MHKIGVRYDQGNERACVGNAIAAWCSAQDYARTAKGETYDALSIYEEAKKIDEFPGEFCSGTSVSAGLEVIRNLGAPRLSSSERFFITEYRWATGMNDILNYVAFVGPIVCGLNWYENFDRPIKHTFNGGRRQGFFIGEGDLGYIRGGHAIILNGYYRNRQGTEWVRFQNSWGHDYPLVWMPIDTLSHVVAQGVEAALITNHETAAWGQS